MTKISKRPLDPKKMDQLYDDFTEAFLYLKTKSEVKNFLFDLLTHTERKMLSKRFQVALLLLEKHDYQTIQEALDVSSTTIARVNNWLHRSADTLLKVARKMIEPPKAPSKKQSGQYIAGDLLTPAIKEGLNFAAREIGKRKQKNKRKRIISKSKA